ncbi:cardiolipin synthase [Bacillus safensis FO-36b] [Bacillus safensis subsp. safensis]
MKKRRLEFLFLYFMIFGAYVVYWWTVPAWSVQLYAAIYIAIILFSIISLMLENRTSQHTL